MLQGLLTGWHFTRWFRLALAIFVGIQAVQKNDGLAGMVAAFLLFQVVTNTGCCGVNNSCATPKSTTTTTVEDTNFEEIK